MAKIAVLGYGTVGSGVVEVLETNKFSRSKRLPFNTHLNTKNIKQHFQF